MEVFNLIESGTTLLTPNRRLSAAYLKQFHQRLLNENKTCWPSIDILPLQSWLQRLWHQYAVKQLRDMPLLLTSNQEMLLWENIVRQSDKSENLLQITATAELARSAWDLISQWQVSIDHPEFSQTEDGKAFQSWAKQFVTTCKQKNWLDTARLAGEVQKKISDGAISIPKKIILLGFTELSPVYRDLLALAEQQGCSVTHYQTPTITNTIHKTSLSDEKTEIESMARWAKAIYDRTPDKTPYLIACVIPRLESLRESVLQIFSDTFSNTQTFTLDNTLLPFNISAGRSLASFPVIHAALELLRLCNMQMPIERISNLLRSPFLGDAEREQMRRANFDWRLRNANITAFSLETLNQPHATYNLANTCPALSKRFKNGMNQFHGGKKVLRISAWVKHFIELLTVLGWPGERSLNSQEYQVTQRWLELLTEYNSFDNILGEVKFSVALDHLIQLTIKTVFQIQTPEAPIQILGVLEAAELPFQHTWVMGFDDANWPSAPKPNPLIPLHLQKTLHMPHATAERELNYCKRLMEQLTNSTSNIIFSYPLKQEDSELRPSSLLNAYPALSINDISLSDLQRPAQLIFETQALETLDHETVPPVDTTEEIRGGANIFKLQAACPFKAFAEIRLYARWQDAPTLGLRAIDRGNIAHKALELLWSKLRNSETLHNMPEDELKDIIQQSAKQAIQLTINPGSNELDNERYISLECTRLEKLIANWLVIEKDRPSFKIYAQEHEIKPTFATIPLTLRIDRIDELEDGSHIIIDYKTGKSNEVKNWFGDRPDEPQLPLYCLSSELNTQAIAFAILHPDKMSLLGVSKRELSIDNVKTLPSVKSSKTKDWEQLLVEWHAILEKLGQEFKQGNADVSPKSIEETCKTCNLKTFCRIHERV